MSLPCRIKYCRPTWLHLPCLWDFHPRIFFLLIFCLRSFPSVMTLTEMSRILLFLPVFCLSSVILSFLGICHFFLAVKTTLIQPVILFLQLCVIQPAGTATAINQFTSAKITFFFLKHKDPPSFLLLKFLTTTSCGQFSFSVQTFTSNSFFVQSRGLTRFLYFLLMVPDDLSLLGIMLFLLHCLRSSSSLSDVPYLFQDLRVVAFHA